MDFSQPHALISVHDKRHIVDLARLLAGRGIQLLSSAGTAEHLRQHGLDVLEVSDYTGFPQLLGGRVKTLHPFIYAGLLARSQERETLRQHGIVPIDWLIVNFYPFAQTVARHDCHQDEGIEHIDIGGPAMIRAAAKNHERVTVVIDPDDYEELTASLQSQGGEVPRTHRQALAAKAFAMASAYDADIARWLAHEDHRGDQDPPARLALLLPRTRRLRYGENPHQSAAFYAASLSASSADINQLQQLQGRSLSYNNVLDSDVACQCAAEFKRPTCVIVKHAMPCAVACADGIESAYQHAYSSDPESAYGGIVAINRPLSAGLARRMLQQQFVELVVAPAIESEAAEVLQTKKNLRLMVGAPTSSAFHLRSVAGGFLLQSMDRDTDFECLVKTRRQPDDALMKSLLFAWRVVRFVRSNAVVVVSGERTVGIGGGQSKRSAATRLAVEHARSVADKEVLVMASDAFLPFRDSLDLAQQIGVQAVIQPGGSIHDDKIIAAADEYDMAMVFTGIRHFSH